MSSTYDKITENFYKSFEANAGLYYIELSEYINLQIFKKHKMKKKISVKLYIWVIIGYCYTNAYFFKINVKDDSLNVNVVLISKISITYYIWACPLYENENRDRMIRLLIDLKLYPFPLAYIIAKANIKALNYIVNFLNNNIKI